MADWSELPIDIIYQLSDKLPNLEDYVNFSSVCKSWNSCFTILKNRSVTYSPWLMLTKRENDNKISEDNELGIRSCYSLSSKKIYNIELPTQGRRCWGTPYPGWVFTMGLDLQINLLNLLSGDQISFPPQPTFTYGYEDVDVPHDELCRIFILKVAFGSNPSESNQRPLALVIHAEYNVSVARHGDKAWTMLDDGFPHNAEDVIFYNGQFYIVDYLGNLGVVDITPTQASARQIAPAPQGITSYHRFYLVEMDGDLYFVDRIFDGINDGSPKYEAIEDEIEVEEIEDEEIEDREVEVERNEDNVFYYKTTDFLVFKYNSSTLDWTSVKDLGDHAFFVGNNTSFSLPTSRHQEFSSNCIYFTDDHYVTNYEPMVPCDMGVYNISGGDIKPIYVSTEEFSQFSRPLFFMPAL